MTSELDLTCATCGGALREATVSPDAVGLSARGPLSVAECTDCGGRYFTEQALDRIDPRGGVPTGEERSRGGS